jgi:hypothetical protein
LSRQLLLLCRQSISIRPNPDTITGGQANAGVYSLSAGESQSPRAYENYSGRTTGAATAINFQLTGDGKVAITGDFVLTNEVIQYQGLAVEWHRSQCHTQPHAD